jgi:hypothetical protein
MRETMEMVAMLQLRKKMALLEDREPDSRMLRDCRHMLGWPIIELRRIRAGVELELRRLDARARERKIATEHLQLIALVESEFVRDGYTAHR